MQATVLIRIAKNKTIWSSMNIVWVIMNMHLACYGRNNE